MSLAIHALHFSYPRSRAPVLAGIDAPALARGALTALVGPNGVGKTTLFRIVAGLLRPASGRMELDGCDLAALPERRRQRRVFHLGQLVAVRSVLTVFDMVLLALKTAGGGRATQDDVREVEATLREVGIEALSQRLVGELSGGQQQLVAIAQALVRKPDVLLLDEPTSALDLRRQLEVMGLIRRVTAERSIVTVAALHDLALAGRYADRFMLLDGGAIVADGDPHDVLASPQLAAAYGIGVHVERSSSGQIVVETFLPDRDLTDALSDRL